jgi:hypothetical protein
MASAEMIRDLADEDDDKADAFVTLCVHAGIAAADVICCSGLGKHAQGESHEDAAALLASVDQDSAKHLRILLRLKTKAGYGHTRATKDEVKKAGRAAEALMETARRVRRVAI